MTADAIRIGALLDTPTLATAEASRLDSLGLESVSLSFWRNLGGADLGSLAEELRNRFGMATTALSVFGNPLSGDEEGEATRATIAALIEAAPSFGARIVSTFAGRIPGTSIPDSLSTWKAVFAPLCERAAALGLSIAFENCRFGDGWKSGRWNIAINPDAWELMFDALPGAPIGLEWEPAHQILALADPLLQLEAWLPRILHIHAKDAKLDRAVLAERGIHGSGRIGNECLAGQGDTDWGAVFRILANSGYGGTVDIEIGATPGYAEGRAVEGIALARAALVAARAVRKFDESGS